MNQSGDRSQKKRTRKAARKTKPQQPRSQKPDKKTTPKIPPTKKQTPKKSAPKKSPRSNVKWFAVYILYFSFAVLGMAEVVHPDHEWLMVVLELNIGIAATLWTITDLRTLGYSMPHMGQWFFSVFWVISLPAYLLWSRGLTGLGWILLHWAGVTTIKYLAYSFAYPFYY